MTQEHSSPFRLEDVLSTAEAARILGVTQTAVRGMVARGRLPGRKIGRNYILPRAAVEVFAREFIKGPGPRMRAAQKSRTRRSTA